ncbi:YybH family protein [Allonocardiopsis opalescens]|uniref:YybH family protein n=1 Tax=Allonocardiopsis opalescens TaxID=1144618 RepID=UPI001FEC16AF|nr:nuclear transport factor 2 family protein [Allonocardiopsis opalescens]
MPLSTEAADHPHVFARAFNSFDPERLDLVYEPEAAFAARPGEPVTGCERVRANAELLALRIPIRVVPRHCYVSGDIALHIVDWTIDGTAPDGRETHLAGTATDVARRGADGYWRYVVDNPFGTACED